MLTISNTNPQSVQLTSPNLTGDSSFVLVPEDSCGSVLPSGASCALRVRFTPSLSSSVSGLLTMPEPNSTITDRVTLTGLGTPLAPGFVLSTINPVVARYDLAPGVSANVFVEFGTSTSYGRQTWAEATSNGGVGILVAGMRQNTTYHMRATVQLANGNVVQDSDHTFTTSAFPNDVPLPTLTAKTMDGMAPQPGIEMVDATSSGTPNFLQAYAVDLEGDIVWGYTYPGQISAIVQPIKLMSNGHLILVASFASQFVSGPTPDSTLVTLREIDLTGATIRELTLKELNAKLASAGRDLTLTDFHHDVTPLPNGHFLLIANTLKEYDNLPGYPGANQIIGDVIIDLDSDFNPVWIWNEFDHLDVNRHPLGLPDWTHTNTVLYAKDDGNILVSLRHQHWILKIDYEDGTGSGKIIWKLGEQGDFALLNGTDPTDWFYAQHQASFRSTNTGGVFELAVMDNGTGRSFPPTVTCDATGQPPCSYSRAPILRVDENARTAMLVSQQLQPAPEFSVWGGGTTSLDNGNLEFDLCAEPNYSSIVREVIPGEDPTLVWQLDITGQNAYRANRIPSLYPGVQW